MPDDPHPPYGRVRHPYFMHEMIAAQPAAIARTVRSVVRARSGGPRPSPSRPLLFVGQGTSFHAALAGAFAARTVLPGGTGASAVASFDLLLEPHRMDAAGGAFVYSASGETALTLRAQEALCRAGVPQILVTATPDSPSARWADQVVATVGAEERSWTHTVSFTTAGAATHGVLARWAGRGSPALGRLAPASRQVLAAARRWRSIAHEFRGCRRLLLLGSGAEEATVREGALKLREGAGRFVATAGVEEFLHGILPSVDRTTGVIAVAADRLDADRAADAVRAARAAGARASLWSAAPVADGRIDAPLPSVPAPCAPIVHTIAFQLLTYWTAVGDGRNPDVMGYNVPRIWRARRSYGI